MESIEILKLFVVTDCLRDYTDGMAVIVAEDEQDARALFEERFKYTNREGTYHEVGVTDKPRGILHFVHGGS